MLKKQIIIPVGEYYVSTDPQEELVSVVGSCIAVTLHDKEKQIGGLVHIVLPGERTLRRTGNRNSFYADTGIPLLVDEMVKAGASSERLVANVAGGASQVAVCGEDTIGSKNAKAAITILKNKGIPIQKKDVGRKTGRKIILSVNTGKLDVLKSVRQPVKPVVRQGGILTDDEANDLIRQIERLKPDNGVAERLLEAVHDSMSSAEKIQKIISEDFVLVYHIFRMCNSTYYGLPGRIQSIPGAKRLLGRRKFRSICVVAGTMRHQENSLDDFDDLPESFRHHPCVTALIARHLALCASPNLREEAYTAGLLHSIGKFGAALLLSKNGQNESLQYNSDLFTNGSNAIAEIILTKWNIPDKIVRAVADFKNPSKGASDYHKLTAIVNVACGLSNLIWVSFGKIICCVDEISPNILSQIGLPDRLEPILPGVFKELRSAGILQKVSCFHALRGNKRSWRSAPKSPVST